MQTECSSNFEIKTYNGVSIIINNEDGYVNASQMCSSNGKKWRSYNKSKTWNTIKHSFESRYLQGDQKWAPSYYLDDVAPKYQGEYIHPKLVHFVAEYCSVDYAFAVAELMDSINDSVHNELNKQQLPDTVENTKPIFDNTVNNIINQNYNEPYESQYCWGVRDSIYRLDSWEQDDLSNDINKYNDIKKQLIDAEKKLDKWGSFIKQYHPEFQK